MLLDTAVGTCALNNILTQALQPQRCMNDSVAIMLPCACRSLVRHACTFPALQISTQ